MKLNENAYDGFFNALNNHVNQSMKANSSVILEIGVVGEDLGLKVSRFNTEIPKGEYYIDRSLSFQYDPITVVTSQNDGHTHNVDIPIPNGFAKIAPGDTVLVAWAEETAIVVSVLISSNDI